MLRAVKRVKFLSWILIPLLLWHYEWSLVYAANQSLPGATTLSNTAARDLKSVQPGLGELRFDALLSELKGVIRQAQAETAAETRMQHLQQLRRLRDDLVTEHAKVQQYFRQLDKVLQQPGLLSEILQRHAAFVQAYQAKYDTLMGYLASLDAIGQREVMTGIWGQVRRLWGSFTGQTEQGDWIAALDQTSRFLDDHTPQPRKSHFDPHNLPHRSLRPEKPLPPKLTPDEWRQAFPLEARGSSGGQPLDTTSGAAPAVVATTPPASEDLAETVEVQFTPEIMQLAADLNNNPVAIFNWVRNNIAFVPTWGSIQGAQLCLENRAGNAFDTASLLIALLRASGIPARYQLGTIEVPIEDAMNWLGGFTNPEAAARFAASGGIPAAGTVQSNGAIHSLRLEHLWVRAYVDYIPSQGAIHREGDTWVHLDPSFKLHLLQPGEDFAAALGVDLDTLIEHLSSTSTLNEAEGFITDVDIGSIESTIVAAMMNLAAAYPDNRDLSALLPSRSVVERNTSILPASSPYTILFSGPETSSLPAALRHSLRIMVLAANGETQLDYEASLPELARKAISILYAFAAEADQAIVREIVTPEVLNLPPAERLAVARSAIPAHLVRVRPVLQLNGLDVLHGEPVGMGHAQRVLVRFTSPTISTPDASTDTSTYGRYAITLDLAGMSQSMLQGRNAERQRLIEEYQNAGGTQEGLSPILGVSQDLVGSTWFASIDEASEISARLSGVRLVRYPSLLFWFPNTSVTSLFGSPIALSSDGYYMDVVRQLHVVTALNGDVEMEKGFSLSTGLQSSVMEGTIPVGLLGLRSLSGRLSAVGALSSALRQEIPVFAISASNVDTVLTRLDERWPRDRIADAIHAGRIVLIPQQPPVIDNELAAGYITLDPQTGDGAYLLGRTLGGRLTCNDDLSLEERESCEFWLMVADDPFLIFISAAAIALTLALPFLPLTIGEHTFSVAMWELLGFVFTGIFLGPPLLVLLLTLPASEFAVAIGTLILSYLLCVADGGDVLVCFTEIVIPITGN